MQYIITSYSYNIHSFKVEYSLASFFEKSIYFLVCLGKRLRREGLSCPGCGSLRSKKVDRKYFVTELRRCGACRLLFRIPTTSADENRAFYQVDYSQGFATDLPSEKKLKDFINTSFAGSERDYSVYISVLKALGCKPGQRLFDFGCSWGYGSFQLKKAGFNVEAFEISLPRAGFAREKLRIDVASSWQDVRGSYDIIFSSHVLEHIPDLKSNISRLRSLLRPGGLFVSFTPNGSFQFRGKNFPAWHQLWGLVHPNFLDEEFFIREFKGLPMVLISNPYSDEFLSGVELRDAQPQIGKLDGDELLFAARTQRD